MGIYCAIYRAFPPHLMCLFQSCRGEATLVHIPPVLFAPPVGAPLSRAFLVTKRS